MRRFSPSPTPRPPASPVPAFVANTLRTDPIRAIDVGAARGLPSHWRPYLPFLRVDAFEPNEAECKRLAARSHPHISWHPTALAGKSGRRNLFVLATPTGSSLYPPAASFVELFGVPGYSEVDHIEPLDCVSLAEHIGEQPAPHLLKLDTQGSELEILQGLRPDQMAGVLAVEAEIEFHEVYQGQPLFPEVHEFMRDAGLMLLDFRVQRAHLTGGIEERHFLRHHLSMATGSRKLTAQLHAVDALYVRPITRLAATTDTTQLLRFATILQMYRYYDGIFWLLSRPEIGALLGAQTRSDLVRAYEHAAPRPALMQRTGLLPTLARRVRRGTSYLLETKLAREGFDPPRTAWSHSYWPDS